MTQTIADLIECELGSSGVAVVIRAEHSCMSIRGVCKPGSSTITSALAGCVQNESFESRRGLRAHQSERCEMPMIIQKEYKFYAAHRNQELPDPCCNLHGHRYGLRCFFEVERSGCYSTLFSDFDHRIEPFLKSEYDHGLLIDVHDTLYTSLVAHMERTGETLKLKVFERPTSAENLAYLLFTEITSMGFRLNRIEIRETDTSVVEYTQLDWIRDSRKFAKNSDALCVEVAQSL